MYPLSDRESGPPAPAPVRWVPGEKRTVKPAGAAPAVAPSGTSVIRRFDHGHRGMRGGDRPYQAKASLLEQAGILLHRALASAARGARDAGQAPEDILISCLGRNIGPDEISADEQLGSTGVTGDALATCLHKKLGTNFSGNDFPSTITLGAILNKIV